MTTRHATDTPLHDLDWQRSASGNAIRTSFGPLHVSIWHRPQGGSYRFTISGALPASVSTTAEAIAFLWTRILCHIKQREVRP